MLAGDRGTDGPISWSGRERKLGREVNGKTLGRLETGKSDADVQERGNRRVSVFKGQRNVRFEKDQQAVTIWDHETDGFRFIQ